MSRLSLSLLVLAGLALAACNTSGRTGGLNVAGASSQGTTNVRIANPDPGKWAGFQPRLQAQTSKIAAWVCRPMACSGKAVVVSQLTNSPTRHPDRKALEKAAKLLATQTKAQDMMMEAASEGDERVTPISSRVTEVRSYPAIVAESKRTSSGKHSYVYRGDLFVGTLLVRLVSSAPDRDEAKRHFDSFATAMEISDVEPSAPSAPAEAPPGPVALDDVVATPAGMPQ